MKSLDGLSAIFWQGLVYILLYFFLTSYINNGHTLTDINIFTVITIFYSLM